jgi:hypothetical protein
VLTADSLIPFTGPGRGTYGVSDAVNERLDRGHGGALHNGPVRPVVRVSGRQPEHPGQSQAGGALPGRGERDVSIQGRKQLPARPDRLPPERQADRVIRSGQIPCMRRDQPGHCPHRT